jgi:hypothetical protein
MWRSNETGSGPPKVVAQKAANLLRSQRHCRIPAAAAALTLALIWGNASEAAETPVGLGSIPLAGSATLQRIFDPEMLNAQIAYLESFTGPAMYIEGSTRIYKIDECRVSIGVEHEKITSLGIATSSKCTFDLARFFPNERFGQANKITFGEILKEFPGQFYAECMNECGNAGNEKAFLQVDGPHSDNFHSLIVEPSGVGEGLVAYLKWKAALLSRGEVWVNLRQYNCDHRFDDVAASAFRDVKPGFISVSGMITDNPQKMCGSRYN